MIFPTAGLDPAGVDDYYAVLSLVDRLSYAGNEAARRYLNGEIDSAVADGARSVILPQVTFGIAVRMAVLSLIPSP